MYDVFMIDQDRRYVRLIIVHTNMNSIDDLSGWCIVD